jgi:hypothetical protein
MYSIGGIAGSNPSTSHKAVVVTFDFAFAFALAFAFVSLVVIP